MGDAVLDVREFLAGLFGVDADEVTQDEDGATRYRQDCADGPDVSVWTDVVEVEWGSFDLHVDTNGDIEGTVHRALAAAHAFNAWKPAVVSP